MDNAAEGITNKRPRQRRDKKLMDAKGAASPVRFHTRSQKRRLTESDLSARRDIRADSDAGLKNSEAQSAIPLWASTREEGECARTPSIRACALHSTYTATISFVTPRAKGHLSHAGRDRCPAARPGQAIYRLHDRARQPLHRQANRSPWKAKTRDCQNLRGLLTARRAWCSRDRWSRECHGITDAAYKRKTREVWVYRGWAWSPHPNGRSLFTVHRSLLPTGY